MRSRAPLAAFVLAIAFAGCTHATLDLGGNTPTPSPSGTGTPSPTPTPPCFGSGVICPVTTAGVGDGGPELAARFLYPQGWAFAPDGGLIIADSENRRIRRIGTDGVITTIAGTGKTSATGTPTMVLASAADLSYPGSIATTADGWIYFADYGDDVVYGIDPATKQIQAIAGGGAMGTTDGVAALDAGFAFGYEAQLSIGVSGSTLFVPDTNHHLVRVVNLGSGTATVAGHQILPGRVVTIAGTGSAGFSGNGGAATAAALNKPTCAVETAAGIDVCDSMNGRLRAIDATGVITAITDGGPGSDGNTPVALALAKLDQPGSLAVLPNGIAIVQLYDNTVRAVNAGAASLSFGGITLPAGTVTNLVGDTGRGYFQNDGGAALTQGLATGYSGPLVDTNGDVLILDNYNSVVRKLSATDDTMSVIAGLAGGTLSTVLAEADDIAVEGSSGSAVIAGRAFARLVRVGADGTRTVVAGNGDPGFSGDGGPATSAGFFADSVARMPDGTLFVADSYNHRVRMITPGGTISTVAGNGYGRPTSGDGGLATSAKFTGPGAVAVDAAGNLFILDDYCVHAVNRGTATLTIGNVSIAPGNIDRIGGVCDNAAFGPENGSALTTRYNFSDAQSRSGLAVDASYVWIADTNNNRIRRINRTDGKSSTFLGGNGSGSTGDGGAASAARAGHPLRLRLANGHVYWAEEFANRVRRADVGGVLVEAVAGTGRQGSSGDGGPALQADMKPRSIDVAPDGSVWIAGENRVRRVLP